MFRRPRVFIAAMLALLTVVGIGAGWSSGTKDAEGASAVKKPVIGLSLPNQISERWVRDNLQMTQYCGEKGITIYVQLANDDPVRQQAQCENLLALGINVLILTPVDATAAAAIVNEASKAKVPVIAYDRLVKNCDLTLYTSFDNYRIGQLQAQYIVDHLDKGNIVIVQGAPTDNNARLFYNGSMSILKPKIDKGDYRVLADQAAENWSGLKTLAIVENALTVANNNLQAVLSPADGLSGFVDQALAAQGLSGKVIVTGQDGDLAACQRIVQGKQSMTIWKDTRTLGLAAIDAAIKIVLGQDPGAKSTVNNGKMDVPALLLAPVVVDIGNLDQTIIAARYQKKESVYGK
jgi:D-xylose transport system substrate-binding protein